MCIRDRLGQAPILICNIDAIWVAFEDVLAHLMSAWNPAKMDELLLLARRDASLGYNGAGDFDLLEKGQIVRRRGETAAHIYAGVQVFKPVLAKPYKAEPFSRNKIWDESLGRNRIFGCELPGYWMHVGDPRARLAAQAVLRQVKI